MGPFPSAGRWCNCWLSIPEGLGDRGMWDGRAPERRARGPSKQAAPTYLPQAALVS